MSDYEKLIDTSHKKLVCICFCNSAGLSMKEITNIFSEYGEVVGINCATSQTGFHFVRYRTKEEALACVIGLEKNTQINLQPVKSKFKERNENDHPNKCYNKKTTSNDISKGNNKERSNLKQEDETGSEKNSQCSKDSKLSDRSKNDKNKARYSKEFCKGNSESEQSSQNNQNRGKSLISERLARNYPNNNSVNESKQSDKFAELFKLRGTNADTFKPRSHDNDSTSHQFVINTPAVPDALMPLSIISSSHSSKSSGKRLLAMDDGPPPLVVAGREEKMYVVTAKVVVVANIHPNLGIHDVYKMFKKFEPIHIADIEIIPDINVRFCYVYFTTSSDAFEAEKIMDRVNFCGNNMIVLRPDKLEEEAGIF